MSEQGMSAAYICRAWRARRQGAVGEPRAHRAIGESLNLSITDMSARDGETHRAGRKAQ